MAMVEFKWTEERVDELNRDMKPREYFNRNKKTSTLDDIATALTIIVARSLAQL